MPGFGLLNTSPPLLRAALAMAAPAPEAPAPAPEIVPMTWSLAAAVDAPDEAAVPGLDRIFGGLEQEDGKLDVVLRVGIRAHRVNRAQGDPSLAM